MIRSLVMMMLAFALLTGCQESPPCTTQIAAQTEPAALPTSAEPPHFSTEALPTDPERYPYNHASSIAELPSGDLLVAWAAGSKEAAEDTVIVVSRRRMGERVWSPPIVLSGNTGQGHANPVLFVDDRATVRLFYSELMGASQLCLSKIYSRTSSDSGLSWSTPALAIDALCLLGRNKPIILRNGEWLLPLYWEAVFQSRIWCSTNRGASWSQRSAVLTLPSANLQPAVVQCADGSLFALMRNGSGAGFAWEARSADCGATWRTREQRDVPNPGSALDMIRLSNGDLLLLCNPSATERTPLAVLRSSDDGKSWSASKAIETGQPQLSYPSIIQARDGTIHVSYSHRLTHIQHAEFNTAWATQDAP